MILINLTPHVIHLPGQSIEPTGLARCEEKSVLVGKIGPIELIAREYGEVAGFDTRRERSDYRGEKSDCQSVKIWFTTKE